jgi:hypothetical protein
VRRSFGGEGVRRTAARIFVEWLAGAAGFEPADGGSKGPCLTAWRRPKKSLESIGKALVNVKARDVFPVNAASGSRLA